MSSSPKSQPTFRSVAPRFVVGDMEQALAFYGQLGFATTYQDGGFAIVERDGISLHMNASEEPPKVSFDREVRQNGAICVNASIWRRYGSCPDLVNAELIDVGFPKIRAHSISKNNSSIHLFTKSGHEPRYVSARHSKTDKNLVLAQFLWYAEMR